MKQQPSSIPLSELYAKYIITRKRVKYARISIKPDTSVHVSIPWHMPKSDVENFLITHEEWVQRQLAKMRLRERVEVAANSLLVWGEEYQMIFKQDARTIIRLNKEERTVTGSEQLLKDPDVIEEWYKKIAKGYFIGRVEELAVQYGFRYSSVRISSAKSKWGSCSTQGKISLSWKLVKAPLAVSDYLIIHELVHTEQFNHSAAFWQRVSSIVPDYKQHEKWLNSYGHSL